MTEELRINRENFKGNQEDYDSIREAIEKLSSVSQNQFEAIKKEKWYNRVFNMLTFSQKGKIRLAEQIKTIAQAQEIFIELLLRLSECDANISNMVAQSMENIRKIQEQNIYLLSKIKRLENMSLGIKGDMDIDKLGDREKAILCACLYMLGNEYGTTSENQKKFANAVIQYLDTDVQMENPTAGLSDIDNEAKRRMLACCMEYIFLKECLPDSYDDYEEFIEEFDLGNKTIKGIKQQISSLYNFRGAEGFYLKYESKNTEKISEVFTVDFKEVEENIQTPEELEEKYERASELFSKYNPKEALPLLKELSNAGYGEANALLYWIYVDGYYENQQYYENPELANEYLIKGYMAGDSISTILYAMYYAKPADEKLISECYSEVKELAENGNIYAEYMLGILDINPIHGQVDLKSAVEHFIKSNRTGFYRAVGSVFLRCFRADEPFTNRDWYQEKFWADRVLKYMHPKRVYQVAYMYSSCEEYGCADTIEQEKAYKMGWNLWMTLTQMGDIAAPNWLGLMYEFGRGVERDMVKAFSYYLLAAQRGDNIGQYNVGNCYYYGEGTETNEVKAIEWYVKSAKQGNNNAKEQLKKIGYYIY